MNDHFRADDYINKRKTTYEDFDSLYKQIVATLHDIYEQNKRMVERKNAFICQQKRSLESIQEIEKRNKCIKPDEWPIIYAFVNKLSPGFYINLQREFPDIAESDIHLCSLIKLGYSTADIAIFLAKTECAVTKQKQRCKVKFLKGSSSSLTSKYLMLEFILDGF